MMARSCRTLRRQLSAFHDGELPVGDQIAVQAHLRECPACAAEARDLDALGSWLRAGVSSSETESDVWKGLPSIVVSRMKAEEAESLGGRTGRLFEDLHLVWAALGATGATVACVAIILTICYYAVSPPMGSNDNPVVPDANMILPTAYSSAFPAATTVEEGESVFALQAVVTREGRVAKAQLLNPSVTGIGAVAERQEVVALLDAIAKARFEPARYAGSPAPVAVNMVWLYASLTVRAKMPELQVTPPKPSRLPIRNSDRVRPASALTV
jgi:hypothetical protein